MSAAAPAPAAASGVLHRALRAATRSDHVALDRSILQLNMSSPSDYGIFLHVHNAALQGLEADWRDEDRSDFAAMVRCAQDDLKTLKLSIAEVRPTSKAPLSAAQRLGIAYVLRGSRLGAGVLRLRVPGTRPSSYLDFAPTLTWPRFLLQLDPASEDVRPASSAEAVRGARRTFDLFGTLLKQALAER